MQIRAAARHLMRGVALAGVAMATSSGSPVSAAPAPLHVLCAGAVAVVIKGVALEFERSHGRPVLVTEGTVGQVRARLAAGDPADVVIVSAPALDALTASREVVAGSGKRLGRTGIGVGMRAGSTAPDLSTPAALKAALLAAPSIATMDPAAGSSSGAYFAELLAQLGIADAVRPKVTLKQSGYSCDLVAAGKADLCVQNISEILPVPGVVVAAPFPESLQNYITYVAGVSARATAPDDARAFIADATSPARASLWKSAGLGP